MNNLLKIISFIIFLLIHIPIYGQTKSEATQSISFAVNRSNINSASTLLKLEEGTIKSSDGLNSKNLKITYSTIEQNVTNRNLNKSNPKNSFNSVDNSKKTAHTMDNFSGEEKLHKLVITITE